MNPLLLAPVGLLIGAVINWLADELPSTGDLAGPSCPACGAPRSKRAWIAWSALLTGARACDHCGTRLGSRHLLVEIVSTVGAVVLAWGELGPAGYGPALLISAIFLLITVIDIEHRLILHAVSLPSILIVGLLGVLDPSRGAFKTLLGGAAGFGSAFGLYLLGVLFARWISHRRGESLDEVAFGFGDVTLAALIGLAVGWPGVILSLLIGILTAGFFSLLYLLWMFLRGQYEPYLPIPYGPFLILGALLVYLGGQDLFAAIGG